ncbi:biopolymer transporter ExbD [Flavobacterium sp. CBA20B-1]|uniref:ExbD/TolR family protein n=1 Tax=unclassified Flavobacterium TaxID=196869 RepID=UPI0022249CDA|nr:MULTISPECIES: biopolymer transporter ExbD [unclassified Flavobacterium]WCM41769.1 biopolymer transporter ExbD [Flavobacterium sp. CBA20B-1]
MAELNTGGNEGKGGKKVRSKKQNAGVDLTAMVDLAFLLITFFMLTTSLSKPQSMDLTMPDKMKDPNQKETQDAKESKTITILIGKDRKLKYYMGMFNDPFQGIGPTDSTYGQNGIRKVILQKMANLKAQGFQGKEGIVVLIKATEDATYTDMIDILDEMAITGVEIYALQDITEEEKAVMQ